MLYQPSGRKGRTPQRHKYTKGTPEPSNHHQLPPILRDNHCGPDDQDCHTHTDSQDHCSQDGRDTIDIWLCTRARHRDGVPDAGLHPHREVMHKQHTHPWSSCCVPFGCPDVHEGTRSNDTRQECSHSNANTLVPVHHLARTHEIDDKSKERKKKGGYISKGFCAKTDLCPLASPRVALVGVCLLRHPDNDNTR